MLKSFQSVSMNMYAYLSFYFHCRADVIERSGMLRTKAMKEAEAQRALRKYRYALIRIRFPDGVLLQG